MKFFPSRYTTFTSEITLQEIKQVLRENTKKSYSLVYSNTKYDFIGFVEKNRFSLISTWSPLGPTCVFNGVIDTDMETIITIETRVNNGFKALYLFWLIGMASVFTFLAIDDGKLSTGFVVLSGYLILSFLFYKLISIISKLSRKHGIKSLIKVLSLTEK